VLTRFGPMFQIERAGGAFVLAAMMVPEADSSASRRRSMPSPRWRTTIAASTHSTCGSCSPRQRPQGIAATMAAIEAATGLPVFAFPKEREYFVEMKLHA
jgi:hypothetical protein